MKALLHIAVKILGAFGCLGFALLGSKSSLASDGGRVYRGTTSDGTPLVLRYADTTGPIEKSVKTQANSHAVTLAKAPSTNGLSAPVPTFASELSASVMSEELRSKIDEEYVRKLKSFMYFHGYDVTSRDARGRFHNVTPEEEIKIREQMARSMRSYMLSRGIPKFLMSRDDTKQLGETYQEVVDSTHVDVTFGEQAPGDRTPPWRMKTGLNPFALTGYFRLTNEVWTFETKNKITNYRQADLTIARRVGKYDVGNRYSVESYVYTPYLDYSFTSNLRGGIHTNFPMKSEKIWVDAQSVVSLDYLF